MHSRELIEEILKREGVKIFPASPHSESKISFSEKNAGFFVSPTYIKPWLVYNIV